MRRTVVAMLHTFVIVILLPVLAASLVSCEPENSEGFPLPDVDTELPAVIPEVRVPEGYENYFIDDLSFSRFESEVKVPFQINVDWTMEVVGFDNDSVSWCSVSSVSGGAGLHKVIIRVSENDTYEERYAKVHLKADTMIVAEIVVSQGCEDAIMLDCEDYFLPYEAAIVEVGIRANVDFDYKIIGDLYGNDSSVDWVRECQKETRSLTTHNQVFEVDENLSRNSRVAYVVFYNSEYALADTLTFIQEGIVCVDGMVVLSKDAEGRPCMSFMPTDAEGGNNFSVENCLTQGNPDIPFSSNPSDMVHIDGMLLVACQGSEDDGGNDEAAIYVLNENTFEVKNVIASNEHDTFSPTKLFVSQRDYSGVKYPVLSSDGKMYSLSVSDAALQPSEKLQSTYAQSCIFSSDGWRSDIVLWDKEVNGLVSLYNGYGPYYCGSKYLLQREELSDDPYYIKNFSKLMGVRTLVHINKTKEQLSRTQQEFIAIVNGRLMIQRVVMSTFFWGQVEGEIGKYVVLDKFGFTKAASKSYKLITENTPCIANATYETMLFANGNKVMKWYYLKDDYLEDAVEILEVGSDEAVITSFDISEDHLKTYVAFYEPNQEGKNGSVWVFDTNSGEVLEMYNNVCYQPVKIIHKK